MSVRERAIALLETDNARHIIYGYQANGELVESGGWENEMLRFWTDKGFDAYVDKMFQEIPGLEMIMAVHARVV